LQLRYIPGKTLLHRLDPRTKLFLLLLFIFIEVAFRDIRIILVPFVVSIILYLSTRVPFDQMKSTWKFLITIIVVIAGVNAIFTLAYTTGTNLHVITRLWIFPITWEGISLAIGAIMRLLSLAIVSVTVLITTDPSLFGPSLSKLGIPYKVSYVFDLALRYLPTYTDDLETTMNAQMARGYRLKGGKGLFARILNTVPLIVPVSINAMLSIYDISDAMELRAFGAMKKRTWYRQTQLRRLDYVIIAITAISLVVAIYARTLFPGLWVP
jgi:energy-coupling factor transport system permease protein